MRAASTRSFAGRCAAITAVLVVAAAACGGAGGETEPTSAEPMLRDAPEVQINAAGAAPVVFVVTDAQGHTFEVSARSDAAVAFSSVKGEGDTAGLGAVLSATDAGVSVTALDGATVLVGNLQSLRFDAAAYSGDVTTGFGRAGADGPEGCWRVGDEVHCEVRLGEQAGGPVVVFAAGGVEIVGDDVPKAEVDELLAALDGVAPTTVVSLGAPGVEVPTCLVAIAPDSSVTSLPPADGVAPCAVTSGPPPTTSTSTTVKPTTTTMKPTTTTVKPTTSRVKSTRTTVMATTTTRPRATTTTVRATTTTVRATTTTTRPTSTSTSTSTSTTVKPTTTTVKPTTTAVPAPTTEPPTDSSVDTVPEGGSGDSGGSGLAWALAVTLLAAGAGGFVFLRTRRRR